MQASRSRTHLVLALVASAAISGCATAKLDQTADASRIDPSKRALAPLDFVSFCIRNRAECQVRGQPAAMVPMNQQTMDALEGVNAAVNARILPTARSSEWRINPAAGNCNDYVVSKRHALLARGFPSSALLINVVKTPTGEGHLVLVVKTDGGDIVLDNLTGSLRSVSQTPYVWIKRQTSADPLQWENA
ncbi:transglutaminase-like cysteine peptidase [Bosea sp. BH3]|uniref:transglutaminase-like cysteine peptidase n=1 Tax=Bosea sp. BH3 TaxID=2871701 RepID=UPI0021CB1AFF|nr:transglutaminase-like cysteine peptidase [Bosea sp. BH3]MCU4181126.1 transglutaminase-like cysteine peptidase [Bosea sp. BH3]